MVKTKRFFYGFSTRKVGSNIQLVIACKRQVLKGEFIPV